MPKGYYRKRSEATELASTQKRKTRAVCGNEVAEEQDHGQAGLVA